ncbi:griF, partial [Symbiodinium sp. CCMP2592]
MSDDASLRNSPYYSPMDNESEQGLKKTTSRWSTARYHVYSFRYLLGLMAIGTLQSTISPSVPYIENTFFAEKYGGDDCEAHPSSDPCRKGATDAAQIGSFTDAAAHAAAMFMAVCLGSYSDSLGRRPMLRAYGAAMSSMSQHKEFKCNLVSWYTRISETPSGQSVGLIVGHYPEKAQLSDAAAYLALIIDEGKGKTTVVEANPPGLTVLKRGAAIANEPDDASEPDFEVSAGNGTLIMKQTGTQQRISMWFPSQGFRFDANLTDPVPWGSSGESPEGWAGRLPFLALHWFVYSLSSHASYRLESPLGVVLGHGRAHQEKNWGQSFPKSWTWGEGLQGESKIAFAGGTVPLGPLKDPAVFWVSNDACRGRLNVTATAPNRMLRISVQASAEETDGLFKVQGPTMSGFKADSFESYRATITAEAFSGILHDKLEERIEFKQSAIEFGGEAWTCPSTSSTSSREEPKLMAPAPPRAAEPKHPRRVRQELRSLSVQQRDRVFNAMNIMKNMSTLQGQVSFGRRYVSYDDLVAQHLQAAAARHCDEAHLGQGFATYHRAFTLRFEESLLAVDPSIGALPYWDYNIEARSKDPRQSEIWEWFGSSEGDPAQGNAVKDGRFGHWRVATAKEISNLSNSFGLLRSPWNVNPSPFITRHRFSCGSQTHFEASFWELCLKAPTYLEWYACVDPTIHTWAHSFLGGIWDTERNVSRVECFATNAIGIPAAWGDDCLQCQQNCTEPHEAQRSCSCQRSGELRCLADRILAHKAPTYGDFADAWTSPNDPIFFFHHANVDRHLMTWQQRHLEKAPHFGFLQPSLPCKGHGLKDIIGAAHPFDGALLGLEDGRLLTNEEVLAADGIHSGPYTYDTLKQAQERPPSLRSRRREWSGQALASAVRHMLVPTLALALHVCGGVTLWLYLILKTVVEAFDINGVYLAMMSDIIEDPQERAAAFGTFMAAVMVLFVAGMPLGYVIPRGVALAISVAAGMARMAYLFVIFPETSRKATQQQSPVQKNPLQTMVSACSLLSKNAFAKRLACVLVCSGIGTAGYGVALPPFMMGYLGYTRSNKLVLMCVAAVSALVAFGVLLEPLVKVLGQVRTLQLCLATSAAVPLLTAVCKDQWQLGVLTPILVFPILMSIPLVSALKSAVVSSRDQGLVQGAVASMTKGASTAGSLIFGSVFAATTGGGK